MVHSLDTPKSQQYFLRSEHKSLLDYVSSRRSREKITNVLVKGPQGCGKSTLPMQYAAVNNLPFAVIEMGLFVEASQLFGSVMLVDGETKYVPGLLTTAIQTPNCVVHIQEINRPESDKTLNAMFSILDEQQRSLWIDDASMKIGVAPGVTFFATMNEGFEFVGTLPLDSALEDRFPIKLFLNYLSEEKEQSLIRLKTGADQETAFTLVSIANSLRNNSQAPMAISTRNILEIAEMVQFGIGMMDAIRATLSQNEDALESLLKTIHFEDVGTTTSTIYSTEYVLYQPSIT
jgi:nitric oxide reductase NorQ protein